MKALSATIIGCATTLFLALVLEPSGLWAEDASEWPTSPYSEHQIQGYLEKNRWNLDPIEGIWNYTEVQIHQIDGVSTKSEPLEDIYRIAIVGRGLQPGAEFEAIILSSRFEDWNFPGRIKAHLTSTGQDGVYAARWYGGSYQEFHSLFVLDPGRRRLNGAFQLQRQQETIVSDVTMKKSFPANTARITRLH